jgi:TM2 domain-containing membrane protein YozV
MEETKICPFCAEKIKKDAIKCRFCWSDLNWEKVAIIKNDIKYKDKNTAWILALLLWWAWIHKFYLWKPIQWLLYLIFIWTFIPAILWVIEWISYFSYKKVDWDYKFNNLWEKPKKNNKSFKLT